MVRADNGNDRVWEVHLFENLRAHDGMDLHLLEFFGRELTGLRNDVLWYGQLADVVENGSGAQSFSFVFAEAKFAGKFDGIDANALEVVTGGLSLGLGGERESVD